DTGATGSTGTTGPTGATGTTGATGAAGGAITIAYTFDTTTSNADPGNGKLRLNNATENAASATYTDLLDSGGSTWTAVLDTLDASTSMVKGQLRLSNANDATKWLTFNLTTRTTHTGYREFALTNTGSSSANPFADGDPLLLEFTRTEIGRASCRERVSGSAGVRGGTGANGKTGSTGV